jgi:aspartyl-tRNA(Asn)/glutamyl-tRNA(Gln) amidotransferase subunit A
MHDHPRGPLSLRTVQGALAADQISPSELLERCLARMPEAQRSGAFVMIDENGARKAAATLDRRRRGPLYGIPCAVKDLVDVAGLPTAAGRASGPVAREDAPIVRMLRAAGAIIVGKTRTDELGLATFTPGTYDPHDPGRSVGGSSGGSAIAVALGAAVLAVATDTAGSARIPAAACGVAGLCASAGGLPGGGTVQLSARFDRLGLIAADGADLELAWQQLTGSSRMSIPAEIYTLAAGSLGRIDAERLAAAEAAAHALGATVAKLTGPPLPLFGAPRAIVITADAAQRHRVADAESPIVRRQLETGRAHTAEDVAAAQHRLDELGEQLRAGIGSGVLVLPTLPGVPPRWDEIAEIDDQLRALGRLTRLCAPINASGLVAVSVPWSTDAAGHSIGVQVAAASEALALTAAAVLSSLSRPRLRSRENWPDEGDAAMGELCCGALVPVSR